MANFPMVPMTWDLDNATFLEHEHGRLVIHRNEGMRLEGSVKDAALALMKYATSEFCQGCDSVILNDTLHIEYEDGIQFSCAGDKPPFWDELIKECDRIVRMRAFW